MLFPCRRSLTGRLLACPGIRSPADLPHPAPPCPSIFPLAALQFLSNVALNLKEGGYFVGTVPDGKRINGCVLK